MSNENPLAELKARLMAVIDSYKQFNKELPAELKATVTQVLGTQQTPPNKDGQTQTPAANQQPNQTTPADAAKPVTASKTISGSVGDKGDNKPEDVLLVKTLLNKFYKAFNIADANTNTKVGATTIGVIKKFQQEKVGSANPDGRIDVSGKTWKVLNGETPPIANNEGTQQPPATNNGKPLTAAEMKDAYAKIAAQYGLEPAVVYAIQEVESKGEGYLSDGRPKILFEPHIFWEQLQKAGKNPAKYVAGNEDILYQKWGARPYGTYAAQYPKLEKAKKIDKIAALKSASWGEFQIMGFNHKIVGYPDVESFVAAVSVQGSTNNINALMKFLESEKLLRHVKGANKNWAALAAGYNGPGYKKNKYDTKMAAAYAKYKNK